MRSSLLYIMVWYWLAFYLREVEGGHFPRIVWSYWHQGFENASTFTKLCLNNQRHYAEASGWTYNLLTQHNIHLFLDVQKVEHLWKMNGVENLQSFADILRILLLLKYGGMWIDANSFFTEDLTWIDSIKHKNHIYNKVGEEPDVILGSYTLDFFERKEFILDEKYPQFNIENWFMVANKNSLFFQEVEKVLEKVIEIGREAANDYYSNFGVKNPFNDSNYFLLSDYIFQVVIQLKSKQLNSSTMSTGMNQYKLWNLEASRTVFMLVVFYGYRIDMLFADFSDFSIQDHKNSHEGIAYFIKITGFYYPTVSKLLQNYRQNYCLGQIFQIKQGSIFDKYLLSIKTEVEAISSLQSFIVNHRHNDTFGRECQNYFETEKELEVLSINLLIIFSAVLTFYFIFQYSISRKLNIK